MEELVCLLSKEFLEFSLVRGRSLTFITVVFLPGVPKMYLISKLKLRAVNISLVKMLVLPDYR